MAAESTRPRFTVVSAVYDVAPYLPDTPVVREDVARFYDNVARLDAKVGRLLDIRVAVLPTVDGEKVVMRLIDKSRKTPTLESLGLSEVMRQKIGEIGSRLRTGMPSSAANGAGQGDGA